MPGAGVDVRRRSSDLRAFFAHAALLFVLPTALGLVFLLPVRRFPVVLPAAGPFPVLASLAFSCLPAAMVFPDFFAFAALMVVLPAAVPFLDFFVVY
ncbi:hypothetical protein [Paraburkholderia lacunae]|uniref:hypothetical protein n=1 Tax=Paraburkholderia lacunae TaxID=2211104 RepID=UPI0010587D56|nr:hypothetical protein [Paraburkholderia lacunae]